jgi:hypothetical protein
MSMLIVMKIFAVIAVIVFVAVIIYALSSRGRPSA